MLEPLKKLFQATDNSGVDLNEIEAFEKQQNVVLPKALKQYLTALGKMNFNKDGMFELRFPNMYKEDDYYVFYECYYMSFRWGIHKSHLNEKNPLIFEQRFYESGDVPWKKIKTNVAEGLFFMALMNGAFHGQLEHTNRAYLAKNVVPEIIKKIELNWTFYGEICDNKIFFNKAFSGVILQEENGICIGTKDQDLYNKTMTELPLEWEK